MQQQRVWRRVHRFILLPWQWSLTRIAVGVAEDFHATHTSMGFSPSRLSQLLGAANHPHEKASASDGLLNHMTNRVDALRNQTLPLRPAAATSGC